LISQRNTHQTTIRFSEELWQLLETAAAEREMSVAQFVREAARARLQSGQSAEPGAGHDGLQPDLRREVDDVRAIARERVQDSSALWEQGRQARLRATQLREQSARQRERHSNEGRQATGTTAAPNSKGADL
jgi:hypothetical protein